MYCQKWSVLLLVILLFTLCNVTICVGQGLILFYIRDSLYMMRPDGVDPVKINETSNACPSPDARFLAILDPVLDHRDNLYIHHLISGKKIRTLKLKVHVKSDISWSPDGQWIVYAGNALGVVREHREDTNMYLISPDGKQHRDLPDQIDASPVGFEWAADSQSIFYNLLASGNRHEIWELNINEKLHPIKHKPFHEGAQLFGTYPSYAFSPNGEQIAYTSTEGVFVANVEGNDHRIVANHGLEQFYQVDWSPNGRNLIFSARNKNEEYGLYIFSFVNQEISLLLSTQDNLPSRPLWIDDALAVVPSNKITMTWGKIKNRSKK